MASIICHDCGERRDRVPRNTRYCKKCRLLRDLTYFKAPTKTCRSVGCSKRFLPGGPQDMFCEEHDFRPADQVGACVICGAHDVPLKWWKIPICVKCGYSTEHRDKIVRSFKAGQEKRRRENSPFTPGVVAGTAREPEQKLPAEQEPAPVVPV